MSTRRVLVPFSDPSTEADLHLVATHGHSLVSGTDFEVRWQMTVEGVETYAAKCRYVDLTPSDDHTLRDDRVISSPFSINMLQSQRCYHKYVVGNSNVT